MFETTVLYTLVGTIGWGVSRLFKVSYTRKQVANVLLATFILPVVVFLIFGLVLILFKGYTVTGFTYNPEWTTYFVAAVLAYLFPYAPAEAE